MTDLENIKAFQCCEANGGQSPQCNACPYHYIDEKNDPCYIEVRREILKILNNEQAQIKSFEAKIVIQKGFIDRQQAEIKSLNNDSRDWKNIAHRETGYGEIAKAEAIKEFAENFLKKVHDNHYLLVDQINSKDYGMFTVGIEQAVDETKKEMGVIKNER